MAATAPRYSHDGQSRHRQRSRLDRPVAVLTLAVCLISAGVPGAQLAPAHADVVLPPVFASGMVLQRSKPVAFWGTALPGEAVTVNVIRPAEGNGDKTAPVASAKTTAGSDGHWRLQLAPLEAGGPYQIGVQGNNALLLQDVLVGEVWFASGQSNMQFPLEKVRDAATEIAGANLPQVREFTVKPAVAREPAATAQGSWRSASPATAGKFSAVAFLFARELHQKLGVPVGIVHAAQGWTPAEAWMSRQALEGDAEWRDTILKRWDELTANYPEAEAAYNKARKEWEERRAAAKATGEPEPRAPRRPVSPDFIHRAAGLWNGSVAPLAGLSIRGVIWYQGETNDARGHQYRKLFPALIQDWRRHWEEPALPFLFVQLASVLPPDEQPAESEWSEVREAQAMALSLPATGMAVTIDIGEEKDVHPANKQGVAHRLALNALAGVYGQKIEYSGPRFTSMKREGGSLRLSFTGENGGLATPGGAPLGGFALAGEDRKFYWAQAQIDGSTVVVSCPQVPVPVAVRYAWANNPMGRANLFSRTRSGELLPASPFRSDDWPGKSHGVTRLPIDN